MALKCWRREASEPKPACCAIISMGAELLSSRRWASTRRWFSSQAPTVVPLA